MSAALRWVKNWPSTSLVPSARMCESSYSLSASNVSLAVGRGPGTIRVPKNGASSRFVRSRPHVTPCPRASRVENSGPSGSGSGAACIPRCSQRQRIVRCFPQHSATPGSARVRVDDASRAAHPPPPNDASQFAAWPRLREQIATHHSDMAAEAGGGSSRGGGGGGSSGGRAEVGAAACLTTRREQSLPSGARLRRAHGQRGRPTRRLAARTPPVRWCPSGS